MAQQNLTDRAYRYRASANAPEGPKVCGYCGTRKQIQVEHINGKEEDTSDENLMWACRSCNTKKGKAFAKMGRGRLTQQFNPTKSGGAANVGEWMQAVGAIVPHKGARYAGENYGLISSMSTADAVAMIRATPSHKRSQYAQQLKGKRNPAKFDRCVKAVGKRGGAVSPYAVCTAAGTRGKKKRARGNPAEAAAEGYRDFHGKDPDEVVTVKKKVHFHRHLSGAGELRGLFVKGIDGESHRITRFKKALLAFNEARNQLFIEGGDQTVNLGDFGIDKPHELETLGKVTKIDYFTDKTHLGKEGGRAVYRHGFATVNEDGRIVRVKILRYPDLIYRVLDEQLEFSGGSYEILPEGIDK